MWLRTCSSFGTKAFPRGKPGKVETAVPRRLCEAPSVMPNAEFQCAHLLTMRAQLLEAQCVPTCPTREENVAALVSSLSEDVQLEWVQRLLSIGGLAGGRCHPCRADAYTRDPSERPPHIATWVPWDMPARSACDKVFPPASASFFVHGRWLYAYSGSRHVKVRCRRVRTSRWVKQPTGLQGSSW